MMIHPPKRRFFFVPWLLAIFIFLTFACQVPPASQPHPSTATPLPQTATPASDMDWFGVYFTEPDSPESQDLRGGPDKKLADAIRRARVSVDMAVLQLDLWSIRDALIDAHRRGVAVRLVTDSDYMDEDEVQDLVQAGVPVLSDRREGLMHNKFVIIDRQEVWTGSMNPTVNEAYRNNNHLMRVQSKRLAENYTREFEEMFVDDQFGSGSPNNTPYPSLNINGIQVETYFSPDDHTERRLIQLVQDAQESIFFLVYSFTADKLANAMLERASEGVTIAGVFEASQYQSNAGTEFDRFIMAGLDVRLDTNPKNMHHKIFIIDQAVVVAGSYNFSYYAETRNDENTLVLHDPRIAALFLEEFHRLYQQAAQP